MTLEITVSDTTPVGTKTFLYNTNIIKFEVTSKNVMEKATSVTGYPIIRWLGETHELKFNLIVEEKGDSVGDATFGLTDLDELRKWSIGYVSTPGLKCWIRDTASGEYFLKDWKVGKPSGFKFVPVQGYPNVVGATLYRVTFKFTILHDTEDKYTMFRW